MLSSVPQFQNGHTSGTWVKPQCRKAQCLFERLVPAGGLFDYFALLHMEHLADVMLHQMSKSAQWDLLMKQLISVLYAYGSPFS